jgi:hypothetical protein
MKVLLPILLCLLCLSAGAPTPAFTTVKVFIDSNQPLSAWQFELTANSIEIVGVESGAAHGFHEPPYYDSEALTKNRIIVGAYTLDEAPPQGQIHVATLHVQYDRNINPDFKVRLMAAGNQEGAKIPATVTIQNGDQP